MAQKKQVSIAEIKVGIFVLVALVLLAALILQQSWGISWFSDDAKAVTYLPNVGGLKPGAPVWLAGIEIGKVRNVKIVPPEVYTANQPIFRRLADLKTRIEALNPRDPQESRLIADLQDEVRDLRVELRFVEVEMDIRKEYLNRISTDSEVTIESRGLIGDSFIEITAGTNLVLPSKLGDAFLIEGVRTTGFREIMTGANDVIANFGVLSDEFKNITRKINPDRVGSTVAETLDDLQTTLRSATVTFRDTTSLIRELKEGDGTIGKIVADPSLYNRLLESIDKVNSIAAKIQTGSGTLSKLINDPQIYDKTGSMLTKADAIMGRMEQGEGTLGKLSKDPALYDSSRKAMEKFAGFVETVDRGEGSLGKLLKDPSLYNNLNQSTAEITKLIYDLRQDPKKYLTIRFRLF